MTRWRSYPVPAVLACLLAGCESQLNSQRFLIEDLDRRLGTVSPLRDSDGVRVKEASEVDDDSGSESKLIHIVSMLRPGTPSEIDLQSVRRSTLANNLNLQTSLLAPDVAAEELRAEQAKFQSTFTASVEQQRTVSPEYYGSSTVNDLTSNVLTVTPGMTVPLRTGGTITLDWTMIAEGYDEMGGDEAFAMVQPSISMTQPLLRGAGFDYNEASIVLASVNLGSMRGEAQLAVINQLVAAEVSYWNLYLAWRQLEIHVEMYKTSKDLLDQQRELVRLNNSTIANVYNFEVALAASVDSVLDSERTLRLAVRSLKVLMQEPDLSLDGSYALQPSTKPRLIAYEFNPQKLVSYALDNRADLLQLEYARIERTIDVMVKDNLVLPEVNVFGGWTFNGFDSDGLSLAEGNRDLFRGDEPGGWNIGVNASIPIGNEIALSNYRASLLNRLKAIADVRDREITVTSEVLNAIDTCETRWKQILTTQYQQQAAQRFFSAYRTLFERGQIPSSNLTQALNSLSSSQIGAATAEANYQIALAQLAQSAGCLLGHAGVEWGDALDEKRLEGLFKSPASPLSDRFEESLDEGGPSVDTLGDSASDHSDGDTPIPGSPQ
jgi:outer membrane protein